LADLDEARKANHTALTLSRQIHTSRDESIKILNRLADIELQSLNWKEAIKIFEQLRTLLPKDPTSRIALIDLYFRLELTPAAMNEVDAYLKLLENENDSQTVEKFLDDLLIERLDNVELHKRMAAYYISQDKLSTAIVKLDTLAEKLLVDQNVGGSMAVVAQIIALNPPNREEYEKLYQELKKK
jgi:regulator of sirC expression with transglutaminase-like and TPR domain